MTENDSHFRDPGAESGAVAQDRRDYAPNTATEPTPADVGSPRDPAIDKRRQAEEVFAVAKGLGPAGFFGLLTIFLPPIGLLFMVAFMGRLQPWIEALGIWGPLAFAGFMIIMAGLSIMPTQVFSVFAGLLIGQTFGLLTGSMVAIGGAVGAAMLMYVWVSFVAKERVMRQVETHRKARIIHRALVDRGFLESLGIVTLLRFPPNMPFALSNFVMASMKVNFPAYCLGTLIGMSPRLAICVQIGMTLGSLDEATKNPYGFWFMVVTVALALIIVMILSHLAKKALAKYDPEANGEPLQPMSK